MFGTNCLEEDSSAFGNLDNIDLGDQLTELEGLNANFCVIKTPPSNSRVNSPINSLRKPVLGTIQAPEAPANKELTISAEETKEVNYSTEFQTFESPSEMLSFGFQSPLDSPKPVEKYPIFELEEVLETEATKEIRSYKPKHNSYTGLEAKKETEKDRSRQDVVNKMMLRMIRRFYHRQFLADNK